MSHFQNLFLIHLLKPFPFDGNPFHCYVFDKEAQGQKIEPNQSQKQYFLSSRIYKKLLKNWTLGTPSSIFLPGCQKEQHINHSGQEGDPIIWGKEPLQPTAKGDRSNKWLCFLQVRKWMNKWKQKEESLSGKGWRCLDWTSFSLLCFMLFPWNNKRLKS